MVTRGRHQMVTVAARHQTITADAACSSTPERHQTITLLDGRTRHRVMQPRGKVERGNRVPPQNHHTDQRSSRHQIVTSLTADGGIDRNRSATKVSRCLGEAVRHQTVTKWPESGTFVPPPNHHANWYWPQHFPPPNHHEIRVTVWWRFVTILWRVFDHLVAKPRWFGGEPSRPNASRCHTNIGIDRGRPCSPCSSSSSASCFKHPVLNETTRAEE
jgi:hypothetical protein